MASLFITGGSGFIGQAFIRQAISEGYTVQALVRSETAQTQVTLLGAQPIVGDLLVPNAWQKSLHEAEYIVHMAQPLTFGGRVTKARAEAYRTNRLQMELNLFGQLDPHHVKRIVYVGGTSYYGQQGTELKDETTPPNPRGWGPYITPSLEALKGYVARGLPIVEAFPGGVYGVGSWYISVLETLYARKRLIGLNQSRPLYASCIHLKDCARAILHLMLQGKIGERYFLVDNRPSTNLELAQLTAQAMNVPLQTLLVPPWLARIFIGPVITDSLQYENRLSNAKLRNTGFECHYPTLNEGVPQVVNEWLNQKNNVRHYE